MSATSSNLPDARFLRAISPDEIAHDANHMNRLSNTTKWFQSAAHELELRLKLAREIQHTSSTLTAELQRLREAQQGGRGEEGALADERSNVLIKQLLLERAKWDVNGKKEGRRWTGAKAEDWKAKKANELRKAAEGFERTGGDDFGLGTLAVGKIQEPDGEVS